MFVTGPDFDQMLKAALAAVPAGPLGVAVSGGGDSMALLLLMADWARRSGHPVFAATVDHGLRPEAAQEAAFVGETAARLGLGHDVLRWIDWDGKGNLQAEARRSREKRHLAPWAAKLEG